VGVFFWERTFFSALVCSSLFSSAIHYENIEDVTFDQMDFYQMREKAIKVVSENQGVLRFKLSTDPYDFFFFSDADKEMQKALLELLKSDIFEDILPGTEVRFFLDQNGLALGYRVDKTRPLYPLLTLEEHLQKGMEDQEYTDSQAVQNLQTRLELASREQGICFQDLSSDRLAMLENRCYLIDIAGVIKNKD